MEGSNFPSGGLWGWADGSAERCCLCHSMGQRKNYWEMYCGYRPGRNRLQDYSWSYMLVEEGGCTNVLGGVKQEVKSGWTSGTLWDLVLNINVGMSKIELFNARVYSSLPTSLHMNYGVFHKVSLFICFILFGNVWEYGPINLNDILSSLGATSFGH